LNHKETIFLPGLNVQLKRTLEKVDEISGPILIIGANSEIAAKVLCEKYERPATIIVEDNDSLIKSRFLISGEKNISVKMMGFDNTDFTSPKFQLIYAQASISIKRRNKILKEIGKIILPGGFLSIGEIVKLNETIPVFVQESWDASELSPLHQKDISKYYLSRGFEILYEEDLSYTLRDFYRNSDNLLRENIDLISEDEKIFHKKLLKKINHESNVYQKLGGDKFIGFHMLLLRKGSS
jgi:hypothetical protein